MEAKYELRAEFNDACDVIATEDGEFVYLEQEENIIAIPLAETAALIDKLGDWLSYGRMA